MEGRQYRVAERMRWAGRVIGLCAALFLLLMIIGGALAEGLGQNVVEAIQGISLGILGLMALAGAVISWWRERLAGILLVSTALGLGIHIGVCAGHSHVFAWSIVGLPYFIAGVLLLNSWWLLRKIS